MFLEGPGAKARDAVHIVFAGEMVKPDVDSLPAPDVSESEETPFFRVIAFDALVRMKLTSFCDKDRTRLRDMIDLEILDSSWTGRLPESLGSRLQQLPDTPGG